MKKILTAFIGLLLFCSAAAQSTTIDQPIKNFEALWSQFNLRYANFELKEVDWQAVYDQYQPQINEQTNNEELFEICCKMVQVLKDGHVGIDPLFGNGEIECGPPYTFSVEEAFPTQKEWQDFQKVMATTFQNYGFSEAYKLAVTEETNFQYRVSTEFIYLRLDEMTEQFILKKLNKAIDQVMKLAWDKKALIIDLRFNGGGYDRAGLQLAARLVTEKRLSHTKIKRLKGRQVFSKEKAIHIKPKGKQFLNKPVVVLVSDFTASAAEVFLLAVKDLPQVTIVGEHSEGIFSDMYEFKLPNKWEVSLSHMQFFDQAGRNFEGKGIAPDYQVVNTKADLDTKIDPVLAKAVELLK